MKVSPSLKVRQINVYISSCALQCTMNNIYMNLTSDYQVQQYPQLLARQTIRILHVLREYVLDNMDKSKCLVLLVASLYMIT